MISMNPHDLTIKTYDDGASQFDQHFFEYFGKGPRISDIDQGLKLAGVEVAKAKVVEIGCGTGRDAEAMVKRADRYEGFDPSKGLIEVAKNKVPKASFVVADALSYKYPKNVDVVFAFASLLHISKDDLKNVFPKVQRSLRKGGIFYISLKQAEKYTGTLKTDQFGDRMFYYYSPELIQQIAGKSFITVFLNRQKIGKTAWFTIALKK